MRTCELQLVGEGGGEGEDCDCVYPLSLSHLPSSLWKTVMSIDIVMQTAHIHCHRTPGTNIFPRILTKNGR